MTSADFRDRANGAMWAALFKAAAGRPFEHRRQLYREYVASTAWRLRRAKEIAKAGGACQECGHTGSAGIPLQVHHLRYDNLGDELERDLVVLCKLCHECRHGLSQIMQVADALCGKEDPERERERAANKRRCGHLAEYDGGVA